MIKLVELHIFECDRCGKETKKELRQNVSKLVISDNDFNKENTVKDLCMDCMASFWSWYTYGEEFDKLANEISAKETGE